MTTFADKLFVIHNKTGEELYTGLEIGCVNWLKINGYNEYAKLYDTKGFHKLRIILFRETNIVISGYINYFVDSMINKQVENGL